MKRVLILGSTGSIGEQTLEVIRACPDRFQVAGLATGRSATKIAHQARQTGAPWVALAAPDSAGRPEVGSGTQILQGPEAIVQLLEQAQYDVVVQGISGAAGLPSSLRTLELGKDLALANKESLVLAGSLLTALSEKHGGKILPVDSEHAAIFQCLQGRDPSQVRKVYLTGSGGPFRNRDLGSFDSIQPEEALRHPTWNMGPRITVGSATMMNKAFEILEAHHLFGFAADQIEVVIHPQSIIHSMVEFQDGNILAQMGLPDMRIPIHAALSYPEPGALPFPAFEGKRFSSLTLEQPDPERYPSLQLGHECLKMGGVSGAVLNAADEVATALFLAGSLSFPDISRTVARVLKIHTRVDDPTLDEIFAADRWARDEARKLVRVPT